MPAGAGLPGSPAGPDCGLHQLLLLPPLLAGSLLPLPLRAVPGPAQSLANVFPSQTRIHAVVCGPRGIQWQSPLTRAGWLIVRAISGEVTIIVSDTQTTGESKQDVHERSSSK